MTDAAASAGATAPAFVLPGIATRIGIVATLVLLLAGLVSLAWTPHPTTGGEVGAQLLDPSLTHPFGTDAAGRDVLSLVMKGLFTSYVVAAVAVAIGLLGGVPLGLVAAAREGWPARLVRGFSAFVSAFPALAFAAILATLSAPGPVVAMVAIGLAAVPAVARATAQAANPLIRSDYVAAARLAGYSGWDAISHHALPVLRHLLLARTLSLLGFAIIAEAALSFVGLGAQTGAMSLGLMLRDAQSTLLFEPVLVLAPGLVVTLAAAALQLAGRDLQCGIELPPRSKEGDDALA